MAENDDGALHHGEPAPGESAPDAAKPQPPWFIRRAFTAAMLATLVGVAAIVYLRSRPAHFEQRAFPGFDLSLPAGELEGSTGYGVGRATWKPKSSGSPQVQISWEPGPLMDRDGEEVLIRGFGAGAKSSSPASRKDLTVSVPGSPPTRSLMLSVDGLSTCLTQIVCGARRVQIATMSRYPGVEKMHQRIASGFLCRPDPVQEGAVGDAPVVFDLGPGWFRLPTTGGQLQLTDGSTHFAIAQVNAGLNLKGAAGFLALPGSIPGMRVGAPNGDSWPISMESEGMSFRGALQVRECPEYGSTLMLMWVSTGPDADQAPAILRKARCRKVGETPQVWPGPPQGATQGP